MRRCILGLIASIALLALSAGQAIRADAVSAQVSGAGTVGGAALAAQFTIQLDERGMLAFDYWDTSSSPPRNIALNPAVEVECLGDLFGGQAVRLGGPGFDSSLGAPVEVQIFLVDGGPAGPDRVSVKTRRPDGTVAYFLPMRDLASGDLTLSCAS